MADIRRTKEELLLPEYNYYICFNIEPTEKDPEKIKKVIMLEKNKWVSGTPTQRRYKDLFNDIENIMINDLGYDETKQAYCVPGARAKELQAAKTLKLKSAEELIIAMSRNKGRIYKQEIIQIANSGKVKWFTPEELEKQVSYLFKQNIKYIDDTQTVVDFRKYKEVEGYLVAAKVTSIYELIGLEPNSPISEFPAKIKEAGSKNAPIATTPHGTARGKILGIAPVIFKTDKTKQDYNNYLAVKEQVWDELELRRQNGIKEISLDEFLAYAEIIKATLKMSIDEVEVLLAAGLKEFKIKIVGSEDDVKDANGDVLNLEVCPYPECGKAYRVYANKPVKSCPHCGRSLEVTCWNCGGKMPFTTKSKTCPTCSCTYQSGERFNSLLTDAERLIANPASSVIDLRAALTNLKNVVPNYQQHKGSLVYKKVEEYEKLIQKRITEEETVGTKYKNEVQNVRTLMAKKCCQQAMNAAQSLLRNYPAYNIDNTKALINDINKIIAEATRHINQAKAYMAQNNETMAISEASKALDICQDHAEARQIIQKFPPQAPTGLRLTVGTGNVVRIEWTTAGNQSMTTYTVIKKVGSKPTNSDDGTVLESGLTINFYEDPNVISATPYYYAVFAERCDIRSPLTTGTGAVQVFMDVTNVRQELVSDAVSVKWDAPHNVKEVEVWKKEGPVAPTQSGDGEKVSSTLEGFTDRSDKESSYLIVCRYDVNGYKRFSKGISRVFKKYEMITKLEKVSIIPDISGDFIIEANEPKNGNIGIIYSKDRINCKFDTAIPTMEFNTVCKNCHKVDVKYNSESKLCFDLPQNQILWVYPMVSNDQLFMLSQPILLNTIEGIKNVSYSENSGTVKISATLDPRIKNVIIKASYKGFATSIDSDGDKTVISKDKFLLEGGATVKLKADSLTYISVLGEIELNGKTTYTGATPISDEPIGNLKKVTVLYVMDYEVSPSKDFTVKIKFEADDPIEIPALCLMKGRPRPMSKNAGELVDKTEPLVLKKGFFSKAYKGNMSIKVHHEPIGTKFAIFIDDDSKRHIILKEVRSL